MQNLFFMLFVIGLLLLSMVCFGLIVILSILIFIVPNKITHFLEKFKLNRIIVYAILLVGMVTSFCAFYTLAPKETPEDKFVLEVNNIISEINSYENITLNESEYILFAKEKYDNLSENGKSEIEDFDVLELALEKIITLELELAKENELVLEINNFISSIPSIDNITINDSENILSIKEKYDTLPNNTKDKIENIATLDLALERIISLKSETNEALVESISIVYGVIGENGKVVNIDGNEYIHYYVPSGTYTITNNSDWSTVFIAENNYYKNSSGYSESKIVDKLNFTQPGETLNISIGSDVHLKLTTNGDITLLNQD